MFAKHRWLRLPIDAQLRRQVDVGADAEQHQARIDEVRLALVLRRAQAASTPLRPESATPPPPISGTAWRIQKLVSAPANCGFSRIASKPVRLAVERIACRRCEQRRAARTRIQSKSRDSSAAAKPARIVCAALRERVAVVAAERAVERRGQVPAAEVAVAVVAEVGRRRSRAARASPMHRRAHEEAVVVVELAAALAVDVVDHGRLRGEARAPGSPGGTGWRRRRRRAAASWSRRSGPSWCPSRGAGTSRGCTASGCCRACRRGGRRAGSSWNRKPRKSDDERLDADAHGVEVVARRRRCAGGCRRTLPARPTRLSLRVVPSRGSTRSARTSSTSRAVEVERRHEAELVVGRLERRVALDQRRARR